MWSFVLTALETIAPQCLARAELAVANQHHPRPHTLLQWPESCLLPKEDRRGQGPGRGGVSAPRKVVSSFILVLTVQLLLGPVDASCCSLTTCSVTLGMHLCSACPRAPGVPALCPPGGHGSPRLSSPTLRPPATKPSQLHKPGCLPRPLCQTRAPLSASLWLQVAVAIPCQNAHKDHYGPNGHHTQVPNLLCSPPELITGRVPRRPSTMSVSE